MARHGAIEEDPSFSFSDGENVVQLRNLSSDKLCAFLHAFEVFQKSDWCKGNRTSVRVLWTADKDNIVTLQDWNDAKEIANFLIGLPTWIYSNTRISIKFAEGEPQ